MKLYAVSWTKVQSRWDKIRQGDKGSECDAYKPFCVTNKLYKSKDEANKFIDWKIKQLIKEFFIPYFKVAREVDKVPYGKEGDRYLVAWRYEERPLVDKDSFDMMFIFRIHEFDVAE